MELLVFVLILHRETRHVIDGEAARVGMSIDIKVLVSALI